jgi:cobalt-zinc-cadmium efflux system outer membrane protein
MTRIRPVGLLLGVAAWASPTAAPGQPAPAVALTYDGALALAEAQAPALRASQAEVEVAGARARTAGLWRANPQLSAAAGPRWAEGGGRGWDWSVAAQQWVELGGQPSLRGAVAQEAEAAARARADDARRRLLEAVALDFAAALYWGLRAALAQEDLRLAEAMEEVARQRHAAGDASGLEGRAARLAAVQARSEAARVAAAQAEAHAHLKRLLGLAPGAALDLQGDLQSIAPLDPAPGPERPDLLALAAELREAEAEETLGAASRVPNLAAGASVSHEEGAHVVQGLLTVTVPALDHGQATRAVAAARRRAVAARLEAARLGAEGEVAMAEAKARALEAAARRFEAEGLSTLAELEGLTAASYEAGALPLGELLALRRQRVEARLHYTELLLGAASARVAHAASRGAL